MVMYMAVWLVEGRRRERVFWEVPMVGRLRCNLLVDHDFERLLAALGVCVIQSLGKLERLASGLQ
jgi:hypothetical protein